MKNKCALIINYSGFGNGFILLPILRELERVEPEFKYYHIENPVLQDNDVLSLAGIKNLIGFVPSIWRRFYSSDYDGIERFIKKHKIDILINLRSPDTLGSNHNYGGFKQKYRCCLEFWDMYKLVQSNTQTQSMYQNIVELFRLNKVAIKKINVHWLKKHFQEENLSSTKFRVGFFVASSQSIKQWQFENWSKLGRMLLDMSDLSINVYMSISPKDRKYEIAIFENLQIYKSGDRVHLIKCNTNLELMNSFNLLDLLISHDTMAIHLATALDLSTIGLYFATNARVWGSPNGNFSAIQSQHGLKCPHMQQHQGDCTAYYGGCLAPCKVEVHADMVMEAIIQRL